MTLPEPSREEIIALAETLAGGGVTEAEPVKAGGNNRLWRVARGLESFALKFYPPQDEDRRDRLGTEWRALTFLAANGIGRVPRPLAQDPEHHCALHEWVEGTPVRAAAPGTVDQLGDFFLALQDLRDMAADIGPASAACFSPSEAALQLSGRLARLAEAGERFPELGRFLRDHLAPAVDDAVASVYLAYPDAAAPLGPEKLCLSPSDFGTHNALKGADGRLVFLDFEYFGWDDPVKATADVMWHAGMDLSRGLAVRFRDRVTPRFAAGDPDLERRLKVLLPVHGLVWCLILLNEFRPDRWARRGLGGRVEDAEALRARQLARAKARLEKIWTPFEGM